VRESQMAGSTDGALVMTHATDMPQDFGLLSMTELRERPGEVLDRVADDGEAFIIERNGKRKACLVPLSVFFPDISPSRIGGEIEELTKHGESARTSITKEHELMFRFPHKLADSTEIDLEIVLPHGYPNTCPRTYARALDGKAPHRWSDGALCLYGVATGWNPGKHTILSTLMLGRLWLKHYEVWRQDGKWPKEEGISNE
jgi:prevent-host-death family protein